MNPHPPFLPLQKKRRGDARWWWKESGPGWVGGWVVLLR